MKPLEQLVKETQGMNPVQFEDWCETNNILTEWLEVCITNPNDGIYNVTLPEYNHAEVYASDGSTIEIIN